MSLKPLLETGKGAPWPNEIRLAVSSRAENLGAAGWLALTASPAFAFMAWRAARDTSAMAVCSSGSSILSIDGMTAMYVLMSLFHLSPWLKLAFARPRART